MLQRVEAVVGELGDFLPGARRRKHHTLPEVRSPADPSRSGPSQCCSALSAALLSATASVYGEQAAIRESNGEVSATLPTVQPDQRKQACDLRRAGSGQPQCAVGLRVSDRRDPGGQQQPGPRVGLDHVRRGPAGMPRTSDALNRHEGRHPNLDTGARRQRRQRPGGEPYRRPENRPVRLGCGLVQQPEPTARTASRVAPDRCADSPRGPPDTAHDQCGQRTGFVDGQMSQHRGHQAAGAFGQQSEAPTGQSGHQHGAHQGGSPVSSASGIWLSPKDSASSRPAPGPMRRRRRRRGHRGRRFPQTTPFPTGSPRPASAPGGRAVHARHRPRTCGSVLPTATPVATTPPRRTPAGAGPQLRGPSPNRARETPANTVPSVASASGCRRQGCSRPAVKLHPTSAQASPSARALRRFTRTPVHRPRSPSPATAGYGRCRSHPTLRCGDGDPAVELSVAVLVAVPFRSAGGVGDVARHIGADLPERDDRIPAHRGCPVDARRFGQPGGTPRRADPATTTPPGRRRAADTSPGFPRQGGEAATAAISAVPDACAKRTVRPLSYRGCTSGGARIATDGQCLPQPAGIGRTTHSTEEKFISATSGRYPNAACPAIAPRLSP